MLAHRRQEVVDVALSVAAPFAARMRPRFIHRAAFVFDEEHTDRLGVSRRVFLVFENPHVVRIGRFVLVAKQIFLLEGAARHALGLRHDAGFFLVQFDHREGAAEPAYALDAIVGHFRLGLGFSL